MTTNSSQPKETSTQTVVRVVALIIGLLGVLNFGGLLIGWVPAVVFGSISLAVADIADKALLLSAGILAALTGLIVIVLGLAIAIPCIIYFFKQFKVKKSWIVSAIVAAVVAFVLFAATCITGGIWAERNREDINTVFSDFIYGLDLDVDDCDDYGMNCDTVQIHDGKIKIRSGLKD